MLSSISAFVPTDCKGFIDLIPFTTNITTTNHLGKISKYQPLQATANVDAETDREIQEVIQECLGDRTVITIAHRVDTVLGCDRVLVMEQGSIVEAGPPTALLQDSTSKFSRFVSN